MQLQQALSQIAEIRRQMSFARHFRGFRAATTFLTALGALAAGGYQLWQIPDPANHPMQFLTVWVALALLSIAICSVEVIRRYIDSDSPSQQELALLTTQQFLPFVLVGGLLTLVFIQDVSQSLWMLPGLWQILFGLGLFSLRRLFPQPIIFIGAFYVLCGLLNISGSIPHFSPLSMAIPFSIGQASSAFVLYWYLERHHAA